MPDTKLGRRRAADYSERVSGPTVDPRNYRVSDAERAHVMALLEKATGRGLITLGEFSERSAIVITAKTRGELNAVLLDLPGLSIAGRSLEQAREQTAASDPSRLSFAGDTSAVPHGYPGQSGFSGPPGPPGYPGFSGQAGYPVGYPPAGYRPGQQVSWPAGGLPSTLELMGWGSRVYRGYWVVPSRIVIGGAGSSTKLDFSSAQLTSTTVRLEFVGNSFGTVDLIVPLGTGIRLDGLQLRGGTVDNRLPPSPGPWPLVLELTGAKRGGSLKIRPAKRRR